MGRIDDNVADQQTGASGGQGLLQWGRTALRFSSMRVSGSVSRRERRIAAPLGVLAVGILLVLAIPACGGGTETSRQDDAAPPTSEPVRSSLPDRPAGNAAPANTPSSAERADDASPSGAIAEREQRTVATPPNSDLVTFDGADYWCETSAVGTQRCVRDSGQTGRISYIVPDVWCDQSGCGYYDPDEHFEVRVNGVNYLCDIPAFTASQQYDCHTYSGGSPIPRLSEPDIYCSGPEWSVECSTDWYPEVLDDFELVESDGLSYICQDAAGGFGNLDCVRYSGGQPPTIGTLVDLYCSDSIGVECSTKWYPAELARYDLWTINGTDHICERATGFDSAIGDLDCHRYTGGGPQLALYGTPDLRCTPDLGSLECASDYYPSQWAIVSIDFQDYACQDTFQGSECFRYYGTGTLSSIGFGIPDFYCNNFGECAEYGYP